MAEKTNGEIEISHHIFPTSATMIGVCLTLITLFKIMRIGMSTLADEFVSINTLLFIISCFFSYLALTGRVRNLRRAEFIADISFFLGILVLAIVGMMIVFIGL